MIRRIRNELGIPTWRQRPVLSGSSSMQRQPGLLVQRIVQYVANPGADEFALTVKIQFERQRAIPDDALRRIRDSPANGSVT